MLRFVRTQEGGPYQNPAISSESRNVLRGYKKIVFTNELCGREITNENF